MSSGLYSSLRLPTALADRMYSHAEHLHAEDVGAEVQLRRQQPVPGAVPRQKGDAPAAQRAEQIRPGWLPERRLSVTSLRSVTSAMSYRPLPPMIPI